MDPEMQLSDIPEHSRSRVEDLEELSTYIRQKKLIAQYSHAKD